MNVMLKTAVAGTIALTSLITDATPIDPDQLSTETTLMIPVTVTSSGTGPEASWQQMPVIKDTIKDGEMVGAINVKPFTRGKICIKPKDYWMGDFKVYTEGAGDDARLRISDGGKQFLLKDRYDTEACTTQTGLSHTLAVTKVGDKMAPGQYNSTLYIAAMYD
ncbi:hypothetical protein G3G68_004874 [Salmonella enterica]|nr:hypothetical protein [Salmonella enterica]EDR4378315.1 hypothetical protein [Salmonella enterica]EEG5735453.1 hypothetical protein [Salmonella enterica]EEG6159302.1 hypothetical protein [Salmonella enterica]EEH7435616.1 hypothetical protein [Salmonella enterica]